MPNFKLRRTSFPFVSVIAGCAVAQCAIAQEAQQQLAQAQQLERVEIIGNYNNGVGTSNAASQGSVTTKLIESRPTLRPAEVLEFVPGLIISQHSGDGKANQYYLRGFNLDVFNLFDKKASDIDYYDESRLIGEPVDGVADLHFHPVEPRTVRVSLAWNF